MNNSIIKSETKEIIDNICIFSNRLVSILKYYSYIENMNIIDKMIIINFISEIAKNIKIDVDNIKSML